MYLEYADYRVCVGLKAHCMGPCDINRASLISERLLKVVNFRDIWSQSVRTFGHNSQKNLSLLFSKPIWRCIPILTEHVQDLAVSTSISVFLFLAYLKGPTQLIQQVEDRPRHRGQIILGVFRKPSKNAPKALRLVGDLDNVLGVITDAALVIIAERNHSCGDLNHHNVRAISTIGIRQILQY